MNVPSASSSASRATLASLRPGESARIVAVDYANHPALVRLMEIGLIPGEQVQMIKQAPLGGSHRNSGHELRPGLTPSRSFCDPARSAGPTTL